MNNDQIKNLNDEQKDFGVLIFAFLKHCKNHNIAPFKLLERFIPITAVTYCHSYMESKGIEKNEIKENLKESLELLAERINKITLDFFDQVINEKATRENITSGEPRSETGSGPTDTV